MSGVVDLFRRRGELRQMRVREHRGAALREHAWRGALALWSALLLTLAHSHLPPVAVVAPVPLLLALRGATLRQAFYLGLLCGGCEFFYLAGTLHASPAIFVALCLETALLRCIFAGAVVALRTRSVALWALTAAAVWVVMEFTQAQVPHGLATLLGDSQSGGPFLSLARVGGTYCVSFFLVWFAALLAQVVVLAWQQARGLPRSMGWSPLARAFVWALASFAWLRLWAWHDAEKLAATVALAAKQRRINIIQGGLPTWVYRAALHEAGWSEVPAQVYVGLTQRAGAAALTVWPETAVWRAWGEEALWQRELEQLAAHLPRDAPRGVPPALLVGLPRQGDPAQWFNSAILLQPAASETGVVTAAFADKRRLALGVEKQFSPGRGAAVLTWPGGTFGVIFCMESTVPDYARAAVLQGAEMLVVLADGSRFGTTPVGHLHARRSIVRAVETGRPVVHAGQQGFSMLIAPSGEILEGPAAPFAAQIVTGDLTLAPPHSRTPFVRFGPWVVAASALWGAILGAVRLATALWGGVADRRRGDRAADKSLQRRRSR